MASLLPNPREPIIDQKGNINASWYRFFAQFERDFNESGPVAGSGISVSGETVSIASNGVSNAMLRDSLGCSVIGRAIGSTGDPGDIIATANDRVLMRSGDVVGFFPLTTPVSLSDGDFGDITVSGGGTTLTVDSNVVTFAKMQDIATDRLIGRDTAGNGDPEQITVGGGIEFTGAAGIQTSAFTGDATKTAGGTALTLATVNGNVGTFGSATQVAQITANAKGLLTAVANVSIAITSSAVTDFAEAVDDRTAALVQNGTGITWAYNDVAGTLTPTVTITQYTDEMARDAIGTALLGTANEITVTPNDGADTITVSLPAALTFTGKTVTGGTFTSVAGLTTSATGDVAVGQDFYLNRAGSATATSTISPISGSSLMAGRMAATSGSIPATASRSTPGPR
jgi:hypothetical protein